MTKRRIVTYEIKRRIVSKQGRLYPWQKKKSGYQIQRYGVKRLGLHGWKDVDRAWFPTKKEAKKGQKELERQVESARKRRKQKARKKK